MLVALPAAPVHWTTYVQTFAVIASTIGTFVYVYFTYQIMKRAVDQGQAALTQSQLAERSAAVQELRVKERVSRFATSAYSVAIACPKLYEMTREAPARRPEILTLLEGKIKAVCNDGMTVLDLDMDFDIRARARELSQALDMLIFLVGQAVHFVEDDEERAKWETSFAKTCEKLSNESLSTMMRLVADLEGDERSSA